MALLLLAEITLALVLLVIVVYKYCTRNFDYWKQRGVPFVPPKAFFGNFQDVLFAKASIGQFLKDIYNKMDTDFIGIWVFGTPHLVLRSPDMIKRILVKDFNYFNDRTITSDEKADPMVSKGLFFVKNPEWRTLRTKTTPIFTSGKIKGMSVLINVCAEELKTQLNKICAQGGCIDAKETMAKFSTDVITCCAFGVQAQSFRHEKAAFREIGKKMFDFRLITAIRGTAYFFAPAIVKLFKLKFFDPSVNEFCREAFTETINAREQSGTKRNDLIDIIIQMKKNDMDGIKFDDLSPLFINFTEGDIVVAQALQFFSAGFETTSSAISFALYELCLHPEMQETLRKEINKTIEEHGGITYDSIKDMQYLDLIIKETLRKYPLLPFLDRRCVKDYHMPEYNLVIEKGTPIYIPMLGLHYDPEYFPEPEKFIPERFTEENIKTRPQYSYIPFGEGPHNCIGERFGLTVTKLAIAMIISNFSVEPTEDTPIPVVMDTKNLLLLPKFGLPMKFSTNSRPMSAVA